MAESWRKAPIVEDQNQPVWASAPAVPESSTPAWMSAPVVGDAAPSPLNQSLGTDVAMRERVIELAQRNPGFADAPSFFIDQTRQTLGLPSFEESNAATSAKAEVDRMGAVRRASQALGGSAMSTAHFLANQVTGDDQRAANNALQNAIIDEDPITGRIASFAGGVIDPAFVAAFGPASAVVRAGAARFAPGIANAATQGGIRGFAAREGLDALAGAAIDAPLGYAQGGVEQAVQDTALGAAGGAVLGGALRGVGSALRLPAALRQRRAVQDAQVTRQARNIVRSPEAQADFSNEGSLNMNDLMFEAGRASDTGVRGPIELEQTIPLREGVADRTPPQRPQPTEAIDDTLPPRAPGDESTDPLPLAERPPLPRRDLSTLSKKELQQEAKMRGIPTKGSRAQLIEALSPMERRDFDLADTPPAAPDTLRDPEFRTPPELLRRRTEPLGEQQQQAVGRLEQPPAGPIGRQPRPALRPAGEVRVERAPDTEPFDVATPEPTRPEAPLPAALRQPPQRPEAAPQTPATPRVSPAESVEAPVAGASGKAAQGADSRQPWQMTRAEYAESPTTISVKRQGRKGAKDESVTVRESVSGINPHDPEYADSAIERNHRAAIARALAEGRRVPPEVLRDYPDLARPVTDRQTPAREPQAGLTRTGEGQAEPARGASGEQTALFSGAPFTPAQLDAALKPIAQPVAEQVKGAAKVVGRIADAHHQPLLERMANSGTSAGREIAARGRAATSETARLLGEWQVPLSDYLHKVSGSPVRRESRKYRKAVSALHQVEMDGEIGFTRFQKAVEDDAFLRTLPQAEQDIVRGYRDLVKLTSQAAQDAGLQIEVNGKMIPFKADPEGRRLIRRPTPFLFDILRRGENDPAFKDLAKRLAEANKIPAEQVIKELNVMADRSVSRRSNVEVARTLKSFPTHARINGTMTPLLESDPFFAAVGMTQGLSHRIGFTKAFGQDGEVPKRLVESMAREGESRFDAPLAEDTLRALSGMPVDMPLFSPGSNAAEAARTVRMLEGLTRAAMLTKSFIPNLPETVAKVPAMAGAGRYLRALKAITADTAGKGRFIPRDLLIETSRNGSRSVNVANWMVQPGHARESLVRMAREIGLVVPRAVNEFNEFFAAVTGLTFAGDLKAGRVSTADRLRLELLGYKPAEIEQLIGGKASDAMYNDVARKVVEQSQGSTSLSAERSRAANSRLYNSVVAFDSYAQMTADRTRRVVGTSFKKLRNGTPRERLAAGKILAEYFGGHTVAGGTAAFLSALSGYGVYGVITKANEAKDDPAAFLADAATYALVGGPFEAIRRTATADGEGGRASELLNTFRPTSAIMDGFSAIMGNGIYRNMSGSERAVKFLEDKVAISRDAKQFMAMWGLGDSDPQLGAALSGYYGWKRDLGLGGGSGDDVPATRTFRVHMRRVSEAMKRDAPPQEVAKHLQAALGETGDAKRVRASLQGRRLLTKADIAKGESDTVYYERLAALRNRIGEDAFRALMNHDSLLDAWADALR